MAIVTYNIPDKQKLLKQAKKDNMDYVVQYMKKSISFETPDVVTVGIKGSYAKVEEYLNANPHRNPYLVWVAKK